MSLHPRSCNCAACQESGFGYPAFQDGSSFPSNEQWNISPMKAPRWGTPSPWSRSQTMSGDFVWDPSDFGRKSTKASRLGFGDPAFVPGTIPPPIPPSAWSDSPAPGPVFQPPGLPENPTAALTFLNSQGQGPSDSTGISPTLTLSQARAQARSQSLTLNSDGTLSPAETVSSVPPAYIVAGIIALLLLK